MTLNIKSHPSPHVKVGRKGYKPEAIVIHIMEGTLWGSTSWFQDPDSKVSAHYGIAKDGKEIHQYVKEKDTSYHAGRVHNPSWELIKPFGENKYINPNYYTIGIEHEGYENSEWDEDMYKASAELISEICKRWSIPVDRNHIVGHNEIYSKKSCPGYKVDLDKLVDMARDIYNNNVEPGIPKSDPGIYNIIEQSGKVKTKTDLNIRKGNPSTRSMKVRTVKAGNILDYLGWVSNGQEVKSITKWFYNDKNEFFWAGGVETINQDSGIVKDCKFYKTQKKFIDYNKSIKNIPDDWRATKGKGIKIAVLDSGIYEHKDLKIALEKGLKENFSGSQANDIIGHGTRCAGIIAANSQTSNGITGVAPQAIIYDVKVRSDEFGIEPISVKNAIKWAVQKKVNIISMSFDIPKDNEIEKMIKKGVENGIIFIAAAGDNNRLNRPQIDFPANIDECIAVGAIDNKFLKDGIFNFPGQLDIISPFIDIYSTDIKNNDEYSCDKGCSFSVPFISGIAALILKKFNPENNITEFVRTKLLEQSIDVGQINFDLKNYCPVINPKEL
ncbi:MAG: S8 family serine peptidase [Bacteroidales bacterium]|nr:S8 family serine peptidase [Bacteroidales bacterium]